MSEKCCNINKNNNNSDDPLASRRTNGGKKNVRTQNFDKAKKKFGYETQFSSNASRVHGKTKQFFLSLSPKVKHEKAMKRGL